MVSLSLCLTLCLLYTRTHTNTHCGQKDGAGEAVARTPPLSPHPLLWGTFSRFRCGDVVWNFCWLLFFPSLDFGVYLGQRGMFSGSGNVDSGSSVQVVGAGCKPGVNQI